MEKLNYYEVLGVPFDASQEEIDRAYRRLARRVHPDLQPPERREWAEEHMKWLNRAHEVLDDPRTRARYDAEIGVLLRKEGAARERWTPPVEEGWTSVRIDREWRARPRPRSIFLMEIARWLLTVGWVGLCVAMAVVAASDELTPLIISAFGDELLFLSFAFLALIVLMWFLVSEDVL